EVANQERVGIQPEQRLERCELTMYRCAIAERCLNGKILQMREVEIIGTVLQMAGLMRRQELIDTKVLFPRGMQADPRRQKEKGPIRGHSRAGVMACRIDRHDRHGTPAQRFCKELQHTGDLTNREPRSEERRVGKECGTQWCQ